MDKGQMVASRYNDGMIRVYWNLHKKCYSLSVYRKGKGWSKVEHKDHVQLKNAFPLVRVRGRERVRKEKRKNVHAFLIGYPADNLKIGLSKITYNPYENETFVINSIAGEKEWEGGSIIMKVDNFPDGPKPRIHLAF